jgi:hypothetical protein
VNKYRPNKDEKKIIEGNGWSFYIEVKDKGNLAIFNPYCLDPHNPLSFYVHVFICRHFKKYILELNLNRVSNLFPKFNDHLSDCLLVPKIYTCQRILNGLDITLILRKTALIR